MMQVFVGAPLSESASLGALAPPVILPRLHVDLGEMTIAARILEVTRVQAVKGTQADDLVATQEYCNAMHQSLDLFVPGPSKLACPLHTPPICDDPVGIRGTTSVAN